MARQRLKKGDITLREMIELSYSVYNKEIDNKHRRSKIDVKSAKVTFRNNMERKDNRWVQTGREVKITLLCRTIPTSYKDTSTIKVHSYPVTFLIKDINKGIDSAFRYRSGGFSKWKFPRQKISEGKTPKEKNRIRTENQRIKDDNIRRGLDGNFFFFLMQVLDLYGLLYGPNTTNRELPHKTNPKLIPYLEKHSLYCLENIIIPILNNKELLTDKNLKVEE